MTKGFTPTGTLRTCYRNSCSADVVKCISTKYSISSDEISEASRLTCFANIINLAGSRSSVQLHQIFCHGMRTAKQLHSLQSAS